MGKYVGDTTWGQNFGLDLLESIMEPSRPVNKELQGIFFKMNEVRSKIQEIRVCTFRMSGKMTDFRRSMQEQSIYLLIHVFAQMHLIAAPQNLHLFNMGPTNWQQ